MAWLVDSHCHLDLPQFDDDRTAVLARAADAGVGLIVVPGIEVVHFPRVLELAAVHDTVYAAVGIHPNSASFEDDAALAAALDAVRQWIFSPAKQGGNPVAVRVHVPIEFRLD